MGYYASGPEFGERPKVVASSSMEVGGVEVFHSDPVSGPRVGNGASLNFFEKDNAVFADITLPTETARVRKLDLLDKILKRLG